MLQLTKTSLLALLLLLAGVVWAQSDIEVSGSNFPANGTYTPNGTVNGKPYYEGPVVTYQYAIQWDDASQSWVLWADYLGIIQLSYFSAAVDTPEPPAAGWVAGGPIGTNFASYTVPAFTGGVYTVVDNDPPTIVALSPANDATDVDPTMTFSVEFSESIKKGTGNINVYKSNGELLEAIDVTKSSNSITISGKTLTFKVGGFSSNETHYILIENGAILDAYDNAFELSDPTVWEFTFQEVTVTVTGAGNPNFDGVYTASGSDNGHVVYYNGDYRIYYERHKLAWAIENTRDSTEGVYLSATVSDITAQQPHDVGYEPMPVMQSKKLPAIAPGPELSGFVEAQDLKVRLTHPADDSDYFPTDGVLEFRFNKNIQKGSGNIYINLDYTTTRAETIDVAGSNVVIDGKSIFIDPVNDFTDYQRYNVTFDNGVIEDADGNAWAGIATWAAGGIDFRARTLDVIVEGAGMREFNLGLEKTANQGYSGYSVYLYKDNNINQWIMYITYQSSAFLFTYVNYSNTTNPPATGWVSAATTALVQPTLPAPNPAPTLRGAVSTYESPADVIWDGTDWSNVTGPSETDVVQLTESLTITEDMTLNTVYIDPSADLVVSGGATLTINGTVYANGDLTIESGSSLITGPNTVFNGKVLAKRNTRYADARYSFTGSPMMESNLIAGYHLGDYVYSYDETVAFGTDGLDRWEDAKASILKPGNGYAQAGVQEVLFYGLPNTTDVTVTGTYTEDTEDANEGWNLVANPFLAALDVESFLLDNTNTTGALYIWDDNGSNLGRGSNSDYIVVNASGATSNSSAGNSTRFNDHIGSMQGFFVQLSDETNTDIVFETDQRVLGNNTDDHYFRSATELRGRLRINLTNQDGLFKQTLVAWNDAVSDDQINQMYDARVFNSNAEYSVFTYKLGQPLAIQTISMNKESVEVGMNIASEGVYELSLENSEYAGGVILIDRLNGQKVDLTMGNYEFTSGSGMIDNRFELRFIQSILAVDQSVQNDRIFVAGDILHVIPVKPTTYRLYDLSGQLMSVVSIESHSKIDLAGYQRGLYLISDGHSTTKFIID